VTVQNPIGTAWLVLSDQQTGGSGKWAPSGYTFTFANANQNQTVHVTNSPVTYDGSTHAATVTCSGGGTPTNVLTGGAANQTNAASYTVTADCPATPGYNVGTGITADNQFVINKATQTVSVNNSPVTYDGNPHAATVTCTSGGASSNVLTGGAATQTSAGTYAVTADCAATANYNSLTAAPAGNFVINKATQTVSVNNSPVTYDSNPHAATVTCSAGGASSNILTGGAATQTNAGTYSVTADCAATTNYNALTAAPAGNFVINAATQTVSVNNSPVTYDGNPHAATVTCSSGGASSNVLTGGAATQTSAGTYAVTADCAATANYNALTAAPAGNFVITGIADTPSVSNSPQTYTGSAIAITVTCASGGSATSITPASQTNAGTYPVTASCPGGGNYTATTNVSAGSFVINPATQTVAVNNSPVTYDGNPHAATVACSSGGASSNVLTGGAATQTSAGSYAVTADCAATANYNSLTAAPAGNFVINTASSTTTVTCPASVTYTGLPQTPCSAAVTGAGGLNQSLTVNYTNNTNVGTAGASASYAGDANHTGSSDSKSFTINPASVNYTITTQATFGGTITPAGSTTVPANGSQSYTMAATQAGYVIQNVVVDGWTIGYMSSYNFTNVTANHKIAVNFTSMPFSTITGSAGSNGRMNPSGAYRVINTANSLFTFYPDPGYQVDVVTVDGSPVTPTTATTYKFIGVTTDHTISVTFKPL
jgi:hypothetical protein